MKNKIKTMKLGQPISDEEINRLMNFDELLRQRDSVASKRKKKLLGLSVVGALLTVGGIIGLYYTNTPEKKPSATTLSESIRKPEVNSSSRSDSAVDQTKPLALTKPLYEKPVSHAASESAPRSNDNHSSTKSVGSQPAQSQPENVYVQAEPVDGYPQLYAWFEKSLVYPKGAVKDSIQGEVTVVFSIDEKGKAQNVHIDNSLGKVFDDEVYRLMASMPLWKPATYNGHYVSGKISLPLTFEIKKLNSKK
jgi:TonB family protein